MLSAASVTSSVGEIVCCLLTNKDSQNPETQGQIRRLATLLSGPHISLLNKIKCCKSLQKFLQTLAGFFATFHFTSADGFTFLIGSTVLSPGE